MVILTITRAKVAPVTKRRGASGQMKEIDSTGPNGIQRMGIVTESGEPVSDVCEVGDTSEYVCVIRGSREVTSHGQLHEILADLGVEELFDFTDIQIPYRDAWLNGASSNPVSEEQMRELYRQLKEESSVTVNGSEDWFTVAV